MKKIVYWVLFLGMFALLFGCDFSKDEMSFEGFWEGPHPEDTNKKFYVQVIKQSDSVFAKGYWTNNSFYNSEFEVTRVKITSDSISFFIPNWNCNYIGKRISETIINGGFSCADEPFDTVILKRNHTAKLFLTEPKPGSSKSDYQYHYHAPLLTNDALVTNRYFSAGDSVFIYSLINEIIDDQYGRINSFLLLKNGKLICEEYFYGYTKDDLHQIESSTKSITSLLIGITKDQGLIDDLEEPIYKIFPYKHLKNDGYEKITLEHILTMTSGFSAEYEPYRDYDRLAFSLKRKLVAEAGSRFIYDGGNTEILGGVIKEKTGMFADAFAEKYLFKPLGINKYDWNTFRNNGYPCMGGSLEIRPRDMAKIGLLVLNDGEYKGQQIVSQEWIESSTAFKTKTHIDGDNYGYQWWNITMGTDDKKYNVIWANGLGSQFIYIIPQLDVVIVTTGYNYEGDSWAISKGIGKYLYLLEK